MGTKKEGEDFGNNRNDNVEAVTLGDERGMTTFWRRKHHVESKASQVVLV